MNGPTDAAGSAQWWFRSRGTAPEQDYTWVDADGAALSAPPGMVDATRLAKPGSLTIVCWTSRETLLLFADGLRSPTWPRDHQGRPIELSVAAAARAEGATRELTAALALFARPTAADDIAAIVSFSAAGIGYSVDSGAWRRMTVAHPRPAAPAVDQPLRWVSSDRSGLQRATAAACDLIAARGERGDASLLVVSDLVSDEDVADLGAYRIVGKHLTPNEGPWPHPKARAVTTPRPSLRMVLVIVLLIAVAIVAASIL